VYTFCPAQSGQRAQVRAVDLHEPDVVGPRALQMRSVDGTRVEVRLDARDGVEQFGGQPVALRRLLPARHGVQRCAQQQDRSGKATRTHGSTRRELQD